MLDQICSECYLINHLGEHPGDDIVARIAVLIPWYNEEAAIYVYDNNSNDLTAEHAAKVGAIVRSETLEGKGHVARRMFSHIDADAYVMAHGDAAYDPTAAEKDDRSAVLARARYGRRTARAPTS